MIQIAESYDWWAHFFRVRHRAAIVNIEAWDRQLIDFLVQVLSLDTDSRVLDVACGSGVHLKLLAERGIGGLGVDISPRLVRHATEATAEHAEHLSFVEGDMRNLAPLTGDDWFDSAVVLSGSFGFFGVDEDVEVLAGIYQALAPGGRLLLDCISPQQSAGMRTRHWEMVDDGYLLSETHYDPASCVRQSGFLYVDGEGVVHAMEEPERIRIYTLPELMGLVGAVGFGSVTAYGAHSLPPVPYDAAHPDRLVVVAQRPLG